MPDVHATITEADRAVVEGLVDILELRAADPQQQAMREAYSRTSSFRPTRASSRWVAAAGR